MFDIQNYGSFIMAILIFQLTPGAGTIAILNATARNGIGTGMCAVLGTLAGDFLYMLAAVLGLAAVLNAYPEVLATAQWIGAAYLCWIGLKLLLASIKSEPAGVHCLRGGRAYFRQALAVSLTNPKVIIFFMAFFPLFLGSDSSPLTLVAMMIHVSTISFIYQALLVLTGNAVARRLSRWRYARLVATRLAGIALIGFGVKLACNKR